MFTTIFLVILSTHASCAYNFSGDLAIITMPVVDGVGFSLDNLGIYSSCESHYRQLPFAQETGKFSCPRMHQFLFNELVKIKEELPHEYKCEMLNVFYRDKGQPCRDIWLLKKDLVKIADLKKKKVDLRCIPAPYTKHKKKTLANILTLIWPWRDSVTDQEYSAGTRFVRAPKQDRAESYGIKILDARDYAVKTTQVPKSVALLNYPASKQECINLFLTILKKWANNTEFIPYVSGGCSFINTSSDNNFELKTAECLGKREQYWERKKDKQTRISGLECSSVIFRIAQIIGMPYFYKNTATLAYYLDPLDKRDELKAGDLIWYSGHVLVVSNIAENKVIESAGYKSGFGKLHEITVDRIFKDIKTYKDLIEAYRAQTPLYRINSSGETIKSIDKFLLLKLDNIWR